MAASHDTTDARRHDLDALRAFAMLLGIVLHGALSFTTLFWPVQDSRQSGVYSVVVAAVHGFRMPVFFVMSGFFTAMLWRRRGLRSVLGHRVRRIVLPLLLGLVTVVPAVDWVVEKAIMSGSRRVVETNFPDGADVNQQHPESGLTPLSVAVIADEPQTVRQLLRAGADAAGTNRDGSTALSVAALLGRTDAAGLLLDNGADVNARAADGSTPLHTAVFFGRAETARLLLERGADIAARSGYGQTPLQLATVDWKTTEFIAKLVQVDVERETVEAGRAAAAELIRQRGEVEDPEGAWTGEEDEGIRALVRSLVNASVFHHLWFLWFLCWLVAGFGVYAAVSDRMGWKGLPDRLVLSPGRFVWLVPLTMVPQWLMSSTGIAFGPDTSEGILPMPHVLAYYAIFFAFGALYYDADDRSGRVGRWWWLSLPLGLFVVFPLGLELATGHAGFRDALPGPDLHRPIAVLLQAGYAWVMTFGLMGVFRRMLRRERRVIRYMSDSSYWLYLTHLPLIIGAQMLVRDWPVPAAVKLALVCAVVTGSLLIAYQTLVRYRWLGRLLNGPRTRPTDGQPAHPGA